MVNESRLNSGSSTCEVLLGKVDCHLLLPPDPTERDWRREVHMHGRGKYAGPPAGHRGGGEESFHNCKIVEQEQLAGLHVTWAALALLQDKLSITRVERRLEGPGRGPPEAWTRVGRQRHAAPTHLKRREGDCLCVPPSCEDKAELGAGMHGPCSSPLFHLEGPAQLSSLGFMPDKML